MFNLLNEILGCTEFLSQIVTTNLLEITDTWEQTSQLYAGLVEKINIAWRVPLDTDLLEEFPDIKMKLVKKLECIAKEKFTILRSLVNRMSNINDCLRNKLDRIHSKLELTSFTEHNDLKHLIREHVMWMEDCWTSLHCFYMQLEFAMISLEVLNENSATNLINAIKQDENNKLIIGKSKKYMQSCLGLLKFLENKSKIKINPQ